MKSENLSANEDILIEMALLEDLVQRGIVHRGQDLCRSRQSLGSLHHKLPFLLLAGTQTVAIQRSTFVEMDAIPVSVMKAMKSGR